MCILKIFNSKYVCHNELSKKQNGFQRADDILPGVSTENF